MFKRKKTILRIDKVTKNNKYLFHTVEVNGKEDEIVEMFIKLVFTLIKYSKVSINDLMIAFKEGIEESEQQ